MGIFRKRKATYDGDAEFLGDGWELVAEHADPILAEINDPDSEMAQVTSRRQHALHFALDTELIPWAVDNEVSPEDFFRGLKPQYGLDMAMVGRRRLRAHRLRTADSNRFSELCAEIESWSEQRADRADLLYVIESERALRGVDGPVDPLRAELADRTRDAMERFEIVLMRVEEEANGGRR